MEALKGVMLSMIIVASTPQKIEYVAPNDDIIPVVEVATDDVPALVDFYATKYGVSKEVMNTVVKCESNYNPNAVGDNGNSFGVSQIHLPSWGGAITEEQARDPRFALDFMAKHLSEGRGRLWTCYRMFY